MRSQVAEALLIAGLMAIGLVVVYLAAVFLAEVLNPILWSL